MNSKIHNLTVAIDHLSIWEALDLLLYEFELKHAKIKFILTGKQYSLEEFRRQHSQQLLTVADASKCGPIEFWGGPPFQRNRYQGNLLTYVWDVILYKHFTKGSYADLFRNESNTP